MRGEINMDEIEGFLLFSYLKEIYDLTNDLLDKFKITEVSENEERIKKIYWRLNSLVRRLDARYYTSEDD